MVLPRSLHGAALGVALAFLSTGCGDLPGSGGPEPPVLDALTATLDGPAKADVEAALEALGQDTRQASSWSALGQALENHLLHGEAADAFLTGAGLDPNNPKPLYRSAINAQRAGDPAAGIERLEQVVELDGTYGPAWRRMGFWQLELGDVEAARSALNRAETLLPGKPDAPLGLARAALLADEVPEALAQAKRAFDLNPNDPYIRLVLGTALRRSGRTDEALTHLTAGNGATPSFSDPWSESAQRSRNRASELMSRGAQFERKRQWSEAADVYASVLAERPDDTKVLLRMGVALMGAKRAKEALAHYEKALARFPGHYELRVAQLSALRAVGSTPTALGNANDLVTRWPDRSAAILVRGSLHRELKNSPAALADFRRVTELDPMDLRGRLFEGQLLIAERRFAEASAALEPGLDVSGVSPPLPYFRLVLQAQAGQRLPNATLQATVERARAVHGAAADSLLRRR